MEFKGRHVCHIADLSTEEINEVLDVAGTFVRAARGEEAPPVHARGRVLSTLFFEPSTRTRLSFESAMARLGGTTLSVASSGSTSLSKGETLADTIRMVAAYSDAIVLRHPHEGAARLAARYSRVPVLNGGDGAGQHPTQTLVDLFTIRQDKGAVAGNRVAIVGDLKYGRTVHSLANALARFGAELVLVAPPTLQMPAETRKALDEAGAKVEVASLLEDVIESVDVIYMTRIQKERFPDEEDYKRVRGTYRITRDLISRGKKGLMLLHPLPRVDEIDADVDADPAARYFEQAANGIPVRMALLSLVLGLKGDSR